jgi:hypothetical protein
MPCRQFKVKQRFGGTYRLLLQDRRISRTRVLLSIWFHAGIRLGFSTLKMEAIFSFETLVDCQRSNIALYPRIVRFVATGVTTSNPTNWRADWDGRRDCVTYGRNKKYVQELSVGKVESKRPHGIYRRRYEDSTKCILYKSLNVY